MASVYDSGRSGRAVVSMPQMRALLLQSAPDMPAAWIQELTDEFIEDPQCRLAVFGGDEIGVVLFSLWDSTVADEVVEGLRDSLPSGATVRLLALAEGGLDVPPESLRQ